MFIIDTQPKSEKTVNWPVTVEVAVDGGRTSKFTFTGTFKLLDDDQREHLLKGSTVDGDPTEESPGEAAPEEDAKQPDAAELNRKFKEGQVDKLAQILVGWSGVVDQDRNPIVFNRENLLTAARSRQGNSLLRGINTAIAQIAAGASAKN